MCLPSNFLSRSVIIALLLIACFIAAATPFAQAATPPGAQIAKVLSADGDDYDNFAYATAIAGEILAVGAPDARSGDNSTQGAVYIFERNQGGPDSWGQVKKVFAPDGDYQDRFGHSVALAGTTLVVGASNAYVNGHGDQGAVYIFERDQGGANNWGQVKKLTAADGAYDDHFGQSVAVAGGVIVVGAPSADVDDDNQGAAYVFGRDQGGANNWGQVKKLVIANSNPGDQFGMSVALTEDAIVVGAPGADLNGDTEAYPPPPGGQSNQGAVYVFGRDKGGVGNWGQEKRITAEDAAGDDNLGQSVAISGDTIAASAPNAGMNTPYGQGAVYVFARNQDGIYNWGQVKKLTLPDGGGNYDFSKTVAIEGDVVVAGVPLADGGSFNDHGAAYVFQRHLGGANNWGQAYQLTAADGAEYDWFGFAVALSNDITVVGAPFADITGYENHGAAYLYSLTPEPGLSIAKAVTPQQDVAKHGVVTYTVTLANSAITDDLGVLFTDTLPAAVDFGAWLLQPPSAAVANDEITWSGPISASQALTFAFTATHTGDYGDVVTNLAEYSGTGRSGLDDATFAVEGPQVSIDKAVTPLTNVRYHGVVTYTVVLANDSVIDEPNVVFTDTLPAEVDFGAWVQQPAGAAVADDTITWSGPVAGGQAVTFSFTASHVGDYADIVTNAAEFKGTLQSGSDRATFKVERLYQLYVDRNGSGVVTSTPAGIQCGSDCSHKYPRGTKITLNAQAAEGHYLSDWGGPCNGNAANCSFTLKNDTYVYVTLPPYNYAFNLNKTGVGNGTVTGRYNEWYDDFNCDENCVFVNRNYNYGTKLVLTAEAKPGSIFAGWSGACTGTNRVCTLTIKAAKEVTATFTPPGHAVTTNKIGDGTGKITSNPAGINCGNDCAETYDHDEAVTMSATADPGSVFIGWGGACTGSSTTCAFVVNGERQLAAAFVVEQPGEHALTVVKSGNGRGTVSSEQTGIACGSNCAETFSHGEVVILEATPDADSAFAGWSGPCTGTGACNVTMDAAKSVTAQFTLKVIPLTVTMDGQGTITSGPAGINCVGDCVQSYNPGALVNLVARPEIGWTFTGWGGACSGTGACAVTMDQVTSVTATFTPSTYALTVTKTGTGRGTVTSNGDEIACGGRCSSVRPHGDTVTLTATAEEGSVFTGWKGVCTGIDDCNVTMTQARSVTATFAVEENENAVFLPTLQR